MWMQQQGTGVWDTVLQSCDPDTEGTTAPQQTRGVCKVGSKLIPCVCDKLLLLSTMNSCEDKNTLWWELCNRITMLSHLTPISIHSFQNQSVLRREASKLNKHQNWLALFNGMHCVCGTTKDPSLTSTSLSPMGMGPFFLCPAWAKERGR